MPFLHDRDLIPPHHWVARHRFLIADKTRARNRQKIFLYAQTLPDKEILV
jgi:hypothetical protein